MGGLANTYAYDFITMSDIEKGTQAIHYVRHPKDDSKSISWVSYCNNEYDRHSVYARTLSFKHKVEIIRKYYKSDFSITSKPGIWRIYEHMRWDVYTRTLGYVLPDKNLLKKEETEDAK